MYHQFTDEHIIESGIITTFCCRKNMSVVAGRMAGKYRKQVGLVETHFNDSRNYWYFVCEDNIKVIISFPPNEILLLLLRHYMANKRLRSVDFISVNPLWTVCGSEKVYAFPKCVKNQLAHQKMFLSSFQWIVTENDEFCEHLNLAIFATVL
jgi:hypothetical protein